MSVDRLRPSYRARLMIDGVNYATTVATKQDAEDRVVTAKAKAINGQLPKRITVLEYAPRWMSTYETAPSSDVGRLA